MSPTCFGAHCAILRKNSYHYCKVIMITQRSPAMWQLQMQVEHKSTTADRHFTFTQCKHLAVTLK